MRSPSECPRGWMTALGLVALCAAGPAWAAAPASPTSMLPGTSSHEPINIDAGKLDYYDKEQKLVYSGGVVAVQGDSTLKASALTIFLAKDPGKPGATPAKGETAAAAATAAGSTPDASASSVRRMEVAGPVTLISKDQVGTGDNGLYDKGENKVVLTGHVTLSQGTNVTKGDKLVYNLTNGQAQVFSGQTNGRVQSIFVPGSAPPSGPAAPAPTTPGKKSAPKTLGTASTK